MVCLRGDIVVYMQRHSAPFPRRAYSGDDPDADKMVVINEASIQLVSKIKEGSRCVVHEGSWESNNGPLVSSNY